jgi:hypothetical protein
MNNDYLKKYSDAELAEALDQTSKSSEVRMVHLWFSIKAEIKSRA